MEESADPQLGGSSRPPDEIYDRYLDACLEGKPVHPESFFARHPGAGPDLRARIEALHRLLRPECDALPLPESAPFDAEQDLPFERLGGFRLLRRLSAGGMGSVFLAEQESLGRVVALKVVRPELESSRNARQRLEREAQVVARLHHPNIVSVHQMGTDHGVHYIAMELVPGRRLDDLMQLESIPPARVVRWAAQLARALSYAHRNGVIHRDVKPSNILITADGRPILVDFGVARLIEEEGTVLTRSFAGSPLYAAPEQVESNGRTVDGRADVYGLGVTLYQCLTGQVPFDGETMEQVFHQVLSNDPPRPRTVNPELGRELEVVILKSMEKAPEARYAAADDLADDLEALLDFRPIQARPPPPHARLYKWARRHPVRATLVGAFASVLLVTVLLLIHARNLQFAAHRERAATMIADAGEQIEDYRRRRESVADLERSVGELQRVLETRYFEPEEDRLLDRREAVFYEVLDLLRRAEGLDPQAEGIEELRALLYLERWQEARTARDPAAQAFYRELVAGHDRSGRLAAIMDSHGTLRLESDPPRAEVHLFRFREVAELVTGGERRLIPDPVGEAELPAAPDAWALRIVAAGGALRLGDLVLSVEGHPVRHAVLADSDAGRIRRGDRLRAIDGRAISGPSDLEEIEPGKQHDWSFVRDGSRFELNGRSRESLGVGFVRVRELAARGDVFASVFRNGELLELQLPDSRDARPVLRTTAAPLYRVPSNVAGRTPLTIDLPHGAYLALLSAEGREPVRVAFPVQEGETTTRQIALPATGEAPPGFVLVPASKAGEQPFRIMDREVTCEEYLRFLNAPETLRAIQEANEPRYYPRSPASLATGGLWPRDAEGRFGLPESWRADWPVLGVSWQDALAYASWRSKAEGCFYALPNFDEWRRAGALRTQRRFPFGNVFRPKWMKSCCSRPQAMPEPVLSYPVDESPLGVYDLSGSALEWIDDWFDRGRGLRRLGGGSWAQTDSVVFKIWGGLGSPENHAWGETGFRLVLHKGPADHHEQLIRAEDAQAQVK